MKSVLMKTESSVIISLLYWTVVTAVIPVDYILLNNESAIDSDILVLVMFYSIGDRVT